MAQTKADYVKAGMERYDAGLGRPEGEHSTWMLAARQQGWDASRAEWLKGAKVQQHLQTIATSELAPGTPTPAFKLPDDTAAIIKELREHEEAQLIKYPLRQYAHAVRSALQNAFWFRWSDGAKAHSIDLVRQLEVEPDRRRGSRLHRKLLVLINKHRQSEVMPASKGTVVV